MKSATPNPHERAARPRGWPGLLVTPLLALAMLSVGHALVTPSCGWDSTLALHLAFAAATIAATTCTALSWRAWRHAGGRPADGGGDDGRLPARHRFVALVGTVLGGYFSLVIVAQWFSVWMMSPCVH